MYLFVVRTNIFQRPITFSFRIKTSCKTKKETATLNNNFNDSITTEVTVLKPQTNLLEACKSLNPQTPETFDNHNLFLYEIDHLIIGDKIKEGKEKINQFKRYNELNPLKNKPKGYDKSPIDEAIHMENRIEIVETDLEKLKNQDGYVKKILDALKLPSDNCRMDLLLKLNQLASDGILKKKRIFLLISNSSKV